MYIPNDFKKKAKRLQPHNTELHRLLDAGNPQAGEHLIFENKISVSLTEAEHLIKTGRIEELNARIQRDISCYRLYQRWLEVASYWEKHHPHHQPVMNQAYA